MRLLQIGSIRKGVFFKMEFRCLIIKGRDIEFGKTNFVNFGYGLRDIFNNFVKEQNLIQNLIFSKKKIHS